MATRIVLAIVFVLVVIYTVPFILYGTASTLWGLQPPASASPTRFLMGVLVTKTGTALAFVGIFAVGRATWDRKWVLYAGLWFGMFLFGEAGELVSGRWTTVDAVLGILSEAIYLPVSALLTRRLLSGVRVQPAELIVS